VCRVIFVAFKVVKFYALCTTSVSLAEETTTSQMLSILIPVYNYAIESLLDQLHQEVIALSVSVEIIVREDGSTSFLELNKAAAERVEATYSIAKENQGRTKTRQWLAEQAQFNHLLFLDADVLPKHPKFLQTYVNNFKIEEPDVMFGGIAYSEEKPEKDKTLRWTFGRVREARPAAVRKTHPYYVISQNLWIKKSLFLTINNFNREGYGLDNVFSYRLQEQTAQVVHLDNPVIHFGIETNQKFLQKSVKALETLVFYEQSQQILNDFTRLQRGYTSLRKRGFIWFFLTVFRIFKSTIERNLLSSQPKMSWFDLYRLYHYAKLKRIKSA
tara:strand:- start:26484 stop:27470 length:987 start_codon:yes stop_codon:yes gene_type:complete